MDIHISYRKNCFDALRYYAAFAVMLLHYTGFFLMISDSGSVVIKKLREFLICFPGVVVLFTISGFLIAASFEHSVSRKEFFKKRIFRLFPELWLCTIINLLVLGILAFESFDQSIVPWIFSQIFGIAYTPSCMRNFATGSINGALWTIFVELQLYFVTLCFYPFLRKLSYIGWAVLAVLFAGINLMFGYMLPSLSDTAQKIAERTFLPYGMWYFIGMFCYVKRDLLLLILRKCCLYLIALYVVFYMIAKQPGYYCGIITSVFCPFITIALAYRLPELRIKMDLSYGIFLYHWIVLNILIYFGVLDRWLWPVTLVLFLGSTLFLSWMSKFIVSKCVRLIKWRKCRNL